MIKILNEDNNIKLIADFINIINTDFLNFDEKEHFLQVLTWGEEYPMFVAPNAIFLSVSDTSYWCQVIYQLSHEIFHYYCSLYNYNRESVKWFEETLCEAYSLLILNLFGNNWEETGLYIYNPEFAKNIFEYIENILNHNENSFLSNIRTFEDLKNLNEHSEDKRHLRSVERDFLFELFMQSPQDIKLLLHYRNYVEANKLIINFELWNSSVRNEFIDKVGSIQPFIEKHNNK